MRNAAWIVVGALFAAACPPNATEGDSVSPIVLEGGTLIDGTGADPVPDGLVVVMDGRIACAGPRGACRVPDGARVVAARDRWVIPGLIDAHVHFSQTGWVDGRPDAVDLRDLYPYEEVQARLRREPEHYFRAYLCSGVTSVFDVGGFPWTWELQERGEVDPMVPRVGAAGPLLSTIDFWLGLPGERQFVYMADEASARSAVRYHAANGTAAIKIWYVMPPEPADTARAAALVRAVADETQAAGIPLIVHATGLWEAKDGVRAGADLLVHSVFADRVDDEFVELARKREVVYTPTITVLEGYGDVFTQRLDDSRYPLHCVDPKTRAFARHDAVPPDRLPASAAAAEAVEGRKLLLQNAMANVKAMFDAGVPIAMGTDAGNPGTFHGPSVYREMELLQEAGLSPMDVLVAATSVSARALGRSDLGTLEVGKRADLLVLTEDPTQDIRNAASVEWVMKDGVLHRRSGLLPLETDGG